MSETRRAMVTIIQRGDREIAGALVAGIATGRAEAERRNPSTAGAVPLPLAQARRQGRQEEPAETVEIVTVEADKWKRVAKQVRVAVGNDKTAEDYRLMIVKARCEYAVHRHTGPAWDVARKLLLAWVMVCQAMRRAYRAQERVLRP